MLSEGLAPWSLSCLRMFTGFVFRGICACVAIGPEIGVHRRRLSMNTACAAVLFLCEQAHLLPLSVSHVSVEGRLQDPVSACPENFLAQ